MQKSGYSAYQLEVHYNIGVNHVHSPNISV